MEGSWKKLTLDFDLEALERGQEGDSEQNTISKGKDLRVGKQAGSLQHLAAGAREQWEKSWCDQVSCSHPEIVEVRGYCVACNFKNMLPPLPGNLGLRPGPSRPSSEIELAAASPTPGLPGELIRCFTG